MTGARSGLGAAVAAGLRRAGYRVVGTTRQPSTAPEGEWRALDLADPADVERFAREHADLLAEAEVWINNAGAGCFGPFSEWRAEDIRAQLELLLTGPMHLCQPVFKAMVARGHGCLVNVSSLSVEFPLPYMPAYNAAKAGLSQLSQTLLLEAPAGVRVIDFQPGDFRTDFNRNLQRTRGSGARLERVWQYLDRHLQSGPPAEAIARTLLAAIQRGHRGRLRAGSTFQTRLAPWGAGLLPARLRRRAHLAYYGVGEMRA